jgi:hypothetical protein
VRETVRTIDPRASIDTVATMEQIVSHSVARQRLYATLLALFAAVAVLLASVGVFAIVAYGGHGLEPGSLPARSQIA